MWSFFCLETTPAIGLQTTGDNTLHLPGAHHTGDPQLAAVEKAVLQDTEIFTGYASDQTEDTDDTGDSDNEDGPEDKSDDGTTGGDGGKPGKNDKGEPQIRNPAHETIPAWTETNLPIGPISALGLAKRKHSCAAAESAVPLLKRQKRETPIRVERNGHKDELRLVRREAMVAIEKQINSSQSGFKGGLNGLQAHQARAIHSYFRMLVQNNRWKIEASERAAEAQGFAA